MDNHRSTDQALSWAEFEKVEARIGTIVSVEAFPEARRPAYILHVDFGESLGVRKSSAQITELYEPEGLIGKQVLAIVNFPPKQIGPIQSTCLVTGVYTDDGVVLVTPDRPCENGSRLV